MALELRPARPDEMAEYVYSGRIGFGQSTAPGEIQQQRLERPMKPEWTLCAFDNGVLAAKMAMLPFTIRWNGSWIACAGVTAVTALPTHRRRGHVASLMRQSMIVMREAGQPLAMLWATMSAIYQRFGYGNVFTNLLYEFDARGVEFVEEIPIPGRTRLLKLEQTRAAIDDVYHAFAAQRTLMLRRGDDWWPRALHLLSAAGVAPLLVACYEEQGQIQGYVVYDVEDGRMWGRRRDQRLQVYDFVWQTPAAHRALVLLLAGYDLARSVRFPSLPADDPLFHHVQEPRLLNPSMTDGTLLRIVDLRPALEGRGYDADGNITFSLADDLCPWNSGTWRLEVEGGQASLQVAAAEPELIVAPRALAMLVSGYQNATALANAGLLSCRRHEAIEEADRIFRTARAPFCMDHF
jgi:predicted acetyltransferase